MEIDIFVVGALMLGAYIGVKLGYNSGVRMVQQVCMTSFMKKAQEKAIKL